MSIQLCGNILSSKPIDDKLKHPLQTWSGTWCYVKDKMSTQTFSYDKIGNELDNDLLSYISFASSSYSGFTSSTGPSESIAKINGFSSNTPRGRGRGAGLRKRRQASIADKNLRPSTRAAQLVSVLYI